MKKIIHILASRLSSLSILTSVTLFSQPSASNQVVTLEVLELNKIHISRDLLALEPVAVLEASAERLVVSGESSLVWMSNGGSRKISISSKQASPSCVVRVNVSAVRGSISAAPKLELRDVSTYDFVRELSRSAGSCEMRFVVVTDDPERVRPHFHAILYTVTSS